MIGPFAEVGPARLVTNRAKASIPCESHLLLQKEKAGPLGPALSLRRFARIKSGSMLGYFTDCRSAHSSSVAFTVPTQTSIR